MLLMVHILQLKGKVQVTIVPELLIYLLNVASLENMISVYTS